MSGGTIDLLRPYANVSEEDWVLLVAWLVGSLMPSGPYPLLVLHGEQGTAKTSLTRYLRQLTDANEAPTRNAPREPRDLAIAARNSRVLAFDNLSHLPAWLSDALCRIATGSGFTTRQLYTDDSEVVFYDKRPVIMNGIEELAVRGDLLSRSIVMQLQRIAPDRCREERELDANFERDHPQILGALLDAFAAALQNRDSTKLASLPRMADFARTAEAAGRALGWNRGRFLRAYERNRRVATEIEIEASPIGPSLLALLASDGWKGSANELLHDLSERAPDPVCNHPTWPRSPKALRGALKRLAPALRDRGVTMDLDLREGKRGDRKIALKVSAERHEVSADTTKCQPDSALACTNGRQADSSDTSDPLLIPRSVKDEEGEEKQQSTVGLELSEVSASREESAS